MRKKIITEALFLLAGLLALFIYAESMPGYGIKSKWKKAVLAALLSAEVPKIGVKEAYAARKKVVWLDARESQEFAVSHISGARFAGYRHFKVEDFATLARDKAIIVYCSIGKRSDEVSRQLMQAGFTNVRNLYGGIFEWFNQGYPVVDSLERETEKMHAYNRVWATWLHRGSRIY